MNDPCNFRHCNVVIADDEEAVTTSVSEIVRDMGHTVVTVDDGDRALETILKSPDHYQLLITDHMMLRMDGLELVEELKNLRFPGKILVLTGYTNVDLAESYRRLGVDKIMHKPFSPGVLRLAVRELTAHSKT